LHYVNVIEGDTCRPSTKAFTAGSQSNKTQFNAPAGGVRQAAAEARLALLTMRRSNSARPSPR